MGKCWRKKSAFVLFMRLRLRRLRLFLKSFGLYCSALICQQNESLDCATFMHYYTTLEGLLLLLKSLCQSIQFFAFRFIHLSIHQKWN